MNYSPKKYKMLVLSNPVVGREDEFNTWYNEQHLGDVVKIPGFVSAQRFKLVIPLCENPWQYCAVYEIEAESPQMAIEELMRRSGTEKLPVSDAMDARTYAVVYEEVTPIVT